jgi:2'-5' RNA ligase
MIRCFAAVEVAPEVRRSLEAVQMHLRRTMGTADPVKWVPAHQFHITLKFLGEVPGEMAERAKAALGRAARGAQPFWLTARSLGAFPGADRPAVLWAGTGEGRVELAALAESVEREMSLEGFGREKRPFRPHITLGRVREGARIPPGLSRALEEGSEREFGRWRADRIVLMRSELTPRGPIYTLLWSAELGLTE